MNTLRTRSCSSFRRSCNIPLGCAGLGDVELAQLSELGDRVYITGVDPGAVQVQAHEGGELRENLWVDTVALEPRSRNAGSVVSMRKSSMRAA
ncbi:MAG: hypothetical protein R3B07_07015 [Polyangiaceae bacterium]